MSVFDAMKGSQCFDIERDCHWLVDYFPTRGLKDFLENLSETDMDAVKLAWDVREGRTWIWYDSPERVHAELLVQLALETASGDARFFLINYYIKSLFACSPRPVCHLSDEVEGAVVNKRWPSSESGAKLPTPLTIYHPIRPMRSTR